MLRITGEPEILSIINARLNNRALAKFVKNLAVFELKVP